MEKKPRTQKGKSILKGCKLLSDRISTVKSMLRNNMNQNTEFYFNNIFPFLIQNESDIKSFYDKYNLDLYNINQSQSKIFARPCPKTPRHGFVESRIVSSEIELKSLLKETLKTDPNGEIVLTKWIENPTYNVVYTGNGSLSVGPGNDGATGGKNAISLQVAPHVLSQTVRKSSGLKLSDNPFIELVFGTYNSYYYGNLDSIIITQVRGGPNISQTFEDFIPKNLTITNVIQPNKNLLEWEKQCKNLPTGTVVFGKGHTLGSHAAIHCVINNIPFITSFEPKVGTLLKQKSFKKNKFSFNEYKQGLQFAFKPDYNNKLLLKNKLNISLTILHNWAYLCNDEKASSLLGYSVGTFLKILGALICGEYRHCINNNNNYFEDRNDIYKTVYNSASFFTKMKQMRKIQADFLNKGKFRKNYGGKKWAGATDMIIKLWNASLLTENNFNNKNINNLISLFNQSVHLVHNNGWLFNKITNKQVVNFISKNPGLTAALFGDILYNEIKSIKNTKINKKQFDKI